MGEQIKSGNYFWRRILGGNFAQILRKIPSFLHYSSQTRKNHTLKTHWILSQGLNLSGLLPLGQKPIWEFQKDLKVSILKSLFAQATCFDGGDFKRGFNLQINIWSEAWIHWNDDDREIGLESESDNSKKTWFLLLLLCERKIRQASSSHNQSSLVLVSDCFWLYL